MLQRQRRYDPEGKRRPLEACVRPQVSIAGLALKVVVYANGMRALDLHPALSGWLTRHRVNVQLNEAVFSPSDENGENFWWLEAPKQGAKERPVPAMAEMMARLSAYARKQRLPALSSLDEDAPLTCA